MNRNRILFILVISFITMFGFKLDVYAKDATELTCIYNFREADEYTQGVQSKKLILQQDKEGKKTLYSSSEDVGTSSASWIKSKDNYSFGEGLKNKDGNLEDCPASVRSAPGGLAGELEELTFSVDGCSAENISCRSLDTANSSKSLEEVKPKENKKNNGKSADSIPDVGDFEDADDSKKIKFIDNTLSLCEEGKFLGDAKLSEIMHSLVVFIKILVPVLLLVLGSFDLVQAIFAQDEGAIKKAQTKFIKRLIIAVVIFLIPTILSAILDIAHGVWSNIDSSLCGILK